MLYGGIMSNNFYTSVEKLSNKILYVGYENGKKVSFQEEFHPTLFIPTKEKTKYKTLFGKKVDSIRPGNMWECKQWIERNESSNFQIAGNRNWVQQYIAEKFPNGTMYDPNLIRIAYIDIEVASDQGFPQPTIADKEVTAIALKYNFDDTVYVWGYGEYVPDENVEYVRCKNENELLHLFLDNWSKNSPDVITGWNVKGFDMLYLVNRISRMLGDKENNRFSPFKMPPMKSKQGDYVEFRGVITLDYLELFRRFGYYSYGNQESYSLDNIANVTLGEKKLDYSEYGTLNELYIQNHQKFIDYNVRDTLLVERIDKQTNMLGLALTLAYKSNAILTAPMGTTKLWETYIYNVMYRNNIVMPAMSRGKALGQIKGGYVKEPHVGAHKWVASFDLNSLYPHLIMQYNMSPETIGSMLGGHTVQDLLNGKEVDVPTDHCITPGGQTFKTTRKGLFPFVIEKEYEERSAIKKEMLRVQQQIEDTGSTPELEQKKVHLNNEQMGIKILMNSLYGAMANEYFTWFHNNTAEAITLSGQLTIQWAEKHVNEYLQKVMKDDKDRIIAIDTDSIYVCLDDFVNKFVGDADDEKCTQFIDKMAREAIEPVLEKCFDKLAKYLSAYDQKMVMKREVIASKVIFTGKKKYIANVINNEGVQYAKPKMKITGIESVRSSTPQVCRKMIEDSLDIIMNQDETTLQEYVKENREQFRTLPVEDVAFPRGVSEVTKYTVGDTYDKGTPIAVRGAILYNKYRKNGSEPIRNNDKVKFTYLKVPNPIGENVIAFPTVLPLELGLHDYIDHDEQFNKAYLSPINIICDKIGWKTEKQSTLEDFFL
jgi:DNA polymerase elongation subunit (family B)